MSAFGELHVSVSGATSVTLDKSEEFVLRLEFPEGIAKNAHVESSKKKPSEIGEWAVSTDQKLNGEVFGYALSFKVYEHHTFGSNKRIGEGTMSLDDLRGGGKVNSTVTINAANGTKLADVKVNMSWVGAPPPYAMPVAAQAAAGGGAVSAAPTTAADGTPVPAGNNNDVTVDASLPPLPVCENRAYTIRVVAHKARNLQSNDDDKEYDPLISVTFGEETKKTDYQKGTINPYFDEELFFMVHKADANFWTTPIQISVMDHYTIGPNRQIGMSQMDAGAVYREDDHFMQNKWLVLRKGEMSTQIMGFLKVSVMVLDAVNDPIPELDEEDEDDEENEEELVMGLLNAPGATYEEVYVRCEIFKGTGIPIMDSGVFGPGLCDPFVKLAYGVKKTQISHKRDTLEPVWDAVTCLPVLLPSLTDSVFVSLWDYDKVGSNEIIATHKLSFNSMVSGSGNGLPQLSPRYVNFYGSPREKTFIGMSGKYLDKMDQGLKPGVDYRGRILMHLSGTRERGTTLIPITQRPEEVTVNFTAVLQGLQFSMLPKGDYKLAVSVATFSHKTEKRTAKSMTGKGSDLAAVFFGDEIRVTGDLLAVIPKNPSDASVASQFPDLIVHIIRGDTLYGSARVPAKELLDRTDAAYRCTTMMVMIDPDKTDEGEQPPAPLGQFYCAMYATGTKFSDAHVPTESDKNIVALRTDIKMPAISMEAQKPYKLECCVYQGRQLPSGDSNGLSDPFVRMSWANGVVQTGIKEETLNPIYNEMLVLDADAKQKFPDVVIEVWDWDRFGSNTFLCRTILGFDDMLKRKDEKWWVDGFRDSKNRECPAALLLSFELMERAADKMPPVVQFLRKRGSRATYKGYEIWPKKRIPTRPYRLEVDVFALRKMRKFRMMDIKCPSIELQVGETIAVVPKKTGSNPDFNKKFSFVVDLPNDKKFLPQLNVRVFDHRIGTKSLVGSAILSMESDKYDPEKQVAVRMAADGEVDKRVVKLTENKRLRLQGVDVLKKEKQDAKRNANLMKQGLRATLSPQSDGRFSNAEGNNYSAPLLTEENPADIHEPINDSEDAPMDAMAALQNFDNANNAQFVDDAAPTEAEAELGIDDIPWFDRFDPPEDLADEMKPEYMVSRLHKLIKDGRKTTAEEQFGPFNDEHDAVVLGRGWGKKRVKCGELSMMFTITTTSDKPSDKIEPTDLIARNAVKYVCRVYLMSCSHLAAKDNSIFGSASDPYPVFILSDGSENNDKKKIVKMKCADDRKYQTLNPEYFIMRELSGELPQHGNLRVEIFDWDRIGSDELIGYTDINLEDRWFSCRGYPERRESTLAPGSYTEKRTLVDPQGQAQGRIEMWVDMFSIAETIPRAISIAPHPPIEMELRVIVWSVRDCVLSDVNFAGEAMTDIYVRAWMNGMRGDRQETDVHYRSLDGSGNFNWRMIFPFVFDPRSKKVMPVNSKSTASSFFRIRKEQKKLEPALKVQIFDNDLFPGTDDFIGEANLNILKMRPARTQRNTTDMLSMIFKDVTTCFGLCTCCSKTKRLDDLTLEERQELAVKEFKKDMADQKDEWGKEAERRVSALRSSKDPVYTEQQLAVFRDQFYKEARRMSMVNALDAFTPKRKGKKSGSSAPAAAAPEEEANDATTSGSPPGSPTAGDGDGLKTTRPPVADKVPGEDLPETSSTSKYWFTCRGPKGAGRVGDVQLSFEAVRKEALKVNLKLEAGKGREGPQEMNPPVRPESSFFFLTSPYKAAVHILWKNYKWWILTFLCILLLALVLYIFIRAFIQIQAENIFETSPSPNVVVNVA